MRSLRATPQGTQVALISLPARIAKKIINDGRLRVGWVRCRIYEHLAPIRCFKCLNYGHIARHCKSDVDRTGICLKCGVDGHKAKQCVAKPKCVLCKTDSPTGNEHPTGSRSCPAYKEALRVAKCRNV